MITSIKTGNEVYVYRNGELMYKRWINQEHGVVFQNYKIWQR